MLTNEQREQNLGLVATGREVLRRWAEARADRDRYRAERDELQARIDSADEAFIDMAQANGGLSRSAERLSHISRIMSALRGHETPHRVSYNRLRTEMRAGADQLRTERDAAQQRLDHLADLARTAENETYDYIVHDSITDLITACKGTPEGGEGQC